MGLLIAPAYWQTRWFQASIAIVIIALPWVAYQRWIGQVVRQFCQSLAARVSKRTCIAREAARHAAPSFQGALLHFHAASGSKNLFASNEAAKDPE